MYDTHWYLVKDFAVELILKHLFVFSGIQNFKDTTAGDSCFHFHKAHPYYPKTQNDVFQSYLLTSS